jgi:Fe-S cluster assembly iron-binding protein IscA
MIQITPHAAEGLKKIRDASGAADDEGIKLFAAQSGGMGMMIASPGEGDAVVEGEQTPLLIVDAALVDGLDGAMLDLTGGDGGDPEFVIRREDGGAPS